MGFKEYENVEYLIKEIVYSIINRNPNIKKTFKEELNLIDIDMFSKKISNIMFSINLNNETLNLSETIPIEELEKRIENCLMIEILSKILYDIPEEQKKSLT